MAINLRTGIVASLVLATLSVAPVAASAAPTECRAGGAEARELLGDHWQRRADLYARDVSTQITDVSTSSPADRNMDAALPAVDRIVTGDMTTLDYLDPATRRFRGDGEARPRRIPFVLTVPETDRAEVPVVIFGHGAKTSRELVYFVANRLAEAGYAAFAVDFPYHGARARGRPGRHEPDDPADGLGNGFADLGLRTDLAETPRVFATTVDRRPTGAPRRRRVSQRTPPVRSSAAKQRPLGTVARDDHTGADADSSDSSPSSGIDRDTLLAEFRGAMIDLELADAIDATDPDLQVDLDPLHERWERAREADFGERTLESAGREIVFDTRRSHDRVTVLA